MGRASLPSLGPGTTGGRAPRTVREVQEVVGRYEYNMDGETYNVEKERPLGALCTTAREILARPDHPIQCVEAVFVGIHLTQGMDVVRFPISFQSKAWREGHGPTISLPENMSSRRGRGAALRRKAPPSDVDDSDSDDDLGSRPYDIHNHLVLGLYRRGLFGAVGISRNAGLQSKSLMFTSLSEMVWDFVKHYRTDRHEVLAVRIGAAVEHAPAPEVYMPTWRQVRIKLTGRHSLLADKRLVLFQEQLLTAGKRDARRLRGAAPVGAPEAKGHHRLPSLRETPMCCQ